MHILGFDIGGTKSAVLLAEWENGEARILKREAVMSDHTVSPTEMLDRLSAVAEGLLTKTPDVIGISCGGPLDAARGVILGPPNLPGWDNVPVVKYLEKRFHVPAKLQNDANACALAEWRFGAGRGCRNMVFMTFGTGLGAGLILDGKLYEGTNGNAGELGHIRLAPTGPVGFGKAGSFEGFCSGGGIARLAYAMAEKAQAEGKRPLYMKEGFTQSDVTAKTVAEAALQGDETAKEVYRTSGEYLGRGLAILIDLLNPELIVIGSVFARSHALLWESAEREIKKEALAVSAGVCTVLPAALGEEIGDYAAIAAALG